MTTTIPPDTSAPTARVVLVDDSAEIRQLVEMALQRHGDFEVTGHAGDGAIGVEVVREQRPDLVVLDVNMPVMDGLTALPLIKEACPEAVVVLLTAATSASVVRQALELGAAAVIRKGDPVRTLVAELRALLEANRPPGAAS